MTTEAERIEELAEEFEENGLYDAAEYLRNHGAEETLRWIRNEIALVRRGDDPWDPEGVSVGNLEVARDRLTMSA